MRFSWTAFHRMRCMNVKWFRKAFKKASFSACHWSWYVLIMACWWLPLTWELAMMFYRNKGKCLRENRVQLPMAKLHFGSPKWPPWRHQWTIYWQNDLVLLSVQQRTCQTHELHKTKKNPGRRNKTKKNITGPYIVLNPQSEAKLYSSVVRTFHGQITSHKCKILERLRLPMSNL